MVKNILSILSSRQATILSGATILMLAVAASKFLGLIRDRLLAHAFSPDQLAVFLAAFRLPDLLFQVLIFGAVSAAFIPVFTEHLNHKGEKEAFDFASDILNVVLVGFIIVVLGVAVIALPLTNLIVPGFSESQKELTAYLTRIILIGQVLLVVGAFFAGVLQSYQRFIVPALAAVVYNLGIILGIIFLVPQFGIYGPAIGVVIGALLHILIQIPVIKTVGYRYRFSLNFISDGMKEMLRLMSFRTVGVAVEQINETVGIILASLVSSSSVTFLTFAQHLQVVPIGLFGSTIAQAAFPILSQERAKGETVAFKTTLLTTFHQILFLVLPATAILIVLRIPAVRLVFGAAQFNWEATVITGKTVALLALGLSAQSVTMLLVRGFYALKDTKTPVVVSAITVTLNIILSVVMIVLMQLPVWSLGIAYAASAIISAVLLLYFLDKKLGGFTFEELMLPAAKMIFAATVSAVALYLPIKALDQLVFDTTRTFNLLLLTGIASAFGLAVYIFMVWFMRVRELNTFGALLKRLVRLQSQVKTTEMVQEPEAV